MRLSWLDAIGAALVALVLSLYAAAEIAHDVPVRGLALVGLLFGGTAHLALGPVSVGGGRLPVFRIWALAAAGLGIATLVTANAGVLAAFMGAIAVLWTVAMLCHAGVLGDGGAPAPPDPDGDELRAGDPAYDERQEEWERNRPGPFVPPGDLPPMPY